MDETTKPAPIAEGQLPIEPEPVAEPVVAEDRIVRSWEARLHLHVSGPIDFDSIPTIEQLVAALQWAVDSKLADKDRRFTISAEIV